MRPRKLTPQVEARLDEIARRKSTIPSFKELERETGLSAGYLRQVVSAKVHLITNKRDDSCGTNAS